MPRTAPVEEPLLPGSDIVVSGDGYCCSCLYILCSIRSGGRWNGCWRLSAFLCFFSIAFWIGVTRNLYCNPEALKHVNPPFGGEMMPDKLRLVERKYLLIQFTRLVDVYTENMTHIGYFYDINLFVIMRFGFSDASGRIWFEARYASFLSRFKPIIEYNLQRCDAGGVGRSATLYQIKEVWWAESYWRCFFNCQRLFNVARRPESGQVMEKLIPAWDFGENAEAQVSFDGWIVPTFRGRITGPVNGYGTGLRQVWSMDIKNLSDDSQIANASQHFVIGTPDENMQVLSRWKVVERISSHLPNWVVGLMAALDDIEE